MQPWIHSSCAVVIQMNSSSYHIPSTATYGNNSAGNVLAHAKALQWTYSIPVILQLPSPFHSIHCINLLMNCPCSPVPSWVNRPPPLWNRIQGIEFPSSLLFTRRQQQQTQRGGKQFLTAPPPQWTMTWKKGGRLTQLKFNYFEAYRVVVCQE